MKKTLLRASLLALSCALSLSAMAQGRPDATVNIPAGDLASSLELLRKQTGLEIIYSASELKGARTKQLSGIYSREEALKRLLEGSGFALKVDASGAYAIVRLTPTPKSPARKRKSVSISPADVKEDGQQTDVTNLPEILVKGSRSLNADIARTEDDIQPYVVFNREDIDLSQASNIEEFLGTRLPMNQSKGTMSRNVPEDDKGNRSSFNLRGLGTTQTLILINGRRAPGVSTLQTGDLGQPDLNGIPLSAVERIEVLPTTASGIYGGGATGGVINVVLRKDYVGSEVRMTYDNTFETDSARRRIEFSSGFTVEGGRTNVMISGAYSDGNDILVRDRDFARRGRELMQRNDPGQLAYWTVLGRQTNVFGYGDLVLDDGTELGSPYASVPAGYAGGDGGLGMLAGAGLTNIQVPDTIAGGRQSLSALPTTKNFSVALRREFSDAIDGYLDYGVYKNKGTTRWAGFGASAYISGDSPGNPFNEAVTVSFPLYDKRLEQVSVASSDTERLNAGFTFELPRSWSASIDFSRNQSTSKTQQQPSTLDTWALMSAIESGEINVFRDLSLYPIDLAPYLTESLSGYGPGKGTMTEYALRAAGPVFKLPAGEVRLTALASNRREEAGDALSIYTSQYAGTPVTTEYAYFPSRHQSVRSYYVEATAPLVSANQNIPLVHSLEAQASFRRDEYTTVSVPPIMRLYLESPSSPIPSYSRETSKTNSNDYTFGLRYKPTEDIALRASFGTGFLPPSLAQISSQRVMGSLFLRDPKRENVVRLTPPLLTSYGGSSTVTPEESKSFSAGIIYTPSFASGLRVSADYTRINKTNEITLISAQEILDLEDILPGRVVRGANLPSDPAGYAGVITELDTSLFNTAESKIEAWDFQVEYERDLKRWGVLQLYGVATLQTTLESRTISTSPVVDRVGYSDGPLRWRGNAGLVWKMGAWTTSLNTQWYDDYVVYASNASEWTQEMSTVGQGSKRIDSQAYTDLSTRYTFKNGLLNGVWVSAGIRNVFGTSPPILATADSRGGYSTYGDPRGRTYVLSLQKSF